MILLALFFAVTATISRLYHAREEGLVAEWFQRGNADLAAGKTARAFEDFRNSLSYAPDDAGVQLHLAEALLADGRYSEARSYLVNLWDETPGAGQVNLDLAHVSLQMGDLDQTTRYFQGAILGSWEKDPALHRRKARLELCEFLLAHRRTAEAQAEIAGLAADTPTGTPAENGVLREENGRLFLRAGKPAMALVEFEAALQIDPRQSQWLADAGQMAFEDGDYLKAEGYFSRADRENPSDEIQSSLLLVRQILGNDPFLAGLSEEEKVRRVRRDFQQGLDRLRGCLATGSSKTSPAQPISDLQHLNQEGRDLQGRMNLGFLNKNPEMQNEVMLFVFQVEDAASRACGPPSGMDQALTLIEKRHQGNNL